MIAVITVIAQHTLKHIDWIIFNKYDWNLNRISELYITKSAILIATGKADVTTLWYTGSIQLFENNMSVD